MATISLILAHFLLLGQVGDKLDGPVRFSVSERALRSISFTNIVASQVCDTFALHDRDGCRTDGLAKLLHYPELGCQPSGCLVQAWNSICVLHRGWIKIRDHLVAISYVLSHSWCFRSNWETDLHLFLILLSRHISQALPVDGFADENTTLTRCINAMTEAKRGLKPTVIIDSFFGALITIILLLTMFQGRSQTPHVLINIGSCLSFFIDCYDLSSNTFCLCHISPIRICRRLIQLFTALQKWLFDQLLPAWW